MPDYISRPVAKNTEPHPALAAIANVLSVIAKQEWEIVEPCAEALLWALNRGDSYILIPRNRLPVLRTCRMLVGKAGDYAPFILIEQHLFMGRIWQLEQDVVHSICRLACVSVEQFSPKVREDLQNWFPEAEAKQQRFAAALALVQHFVLINGGPGTGKTTTVAKILALILKHVWQAPYPPKIALVAPTGKAATNMAAALHNALFKLHLPANIRKSLSQLTGQTVHRLLQLRPPLLNSEFNAENTLEIDILVVDESSMLDLSLFRTLLQALKTNVRLILLGDSNQLPAVGVGNVLAELSQTTMLTPAITKQLSFLLPDQPLPPSQSDAGIAAHVATLTHSYRFDPSKGIGALATACIKGDGMMALSVMESFEQLYWLQPNQSTLFQRLYHLQQAWWQAVAANDVQAVFNHLTDVMVLGVRRVDVKTFNKQYRRYLSGQLHIVTDTWFAGMPILITQNDYDIGVYNGDIGVILPDTDDKQHLLAYFNVGQCIRTIALSRLPQYEPAFAITVHKSQGSEYNNVWLLAPQSPATEDDVLFNRVLMYTALTRARQYFAFCGSAQQMTQAIKNNDQRRSGLRIALNQLMKQQSQMTLF